MKFKSGQNVVLKETGEKCRVMGYTKNGLVTLAKADGRLYGDFAEDAIAANSCASSNPVVQNALKACNAKFKLGDVVTDEYGDKAVVLNPDAGNGSVKVKYVKDQKLVIVAPEEIKKAHNSTAANAEVAKNGKFGFDSASAVTLKSIKNARVAMQNARLYIGQAEDNDEAPGQARDIDEIIKKIDNLIGWLKDYA